MQFSPKKLEGSKNGFDLSKQFRPEFLSDFASSPMSNGAFINPSALKDLSDDDVLSATYSKTITEILVPQIV